MILRSVIALMLWAQQPSADQFSGYSVSLKNVACDGTHIHGEPLHCVDSRGKDMDVPSRDNPYIDGKGWVAISGPSPTPEPAKPELVCRMAFVWDGDNLQGEEQPIKICWAGEAEDVPAVEMSAIVSMRHISCSDKQDRDAGVSCSEPVYLNYWECADRSRILLTAEDGTRWCHKPAKDTTTK